MNAITLVLLIALDGLVGAGIPKQIERFGGGSARVEAVFVRAPGESVQIEASLFLDGGKLLAPLAGALPLVEASSGDPRLLSGTLNLPLPDVEKPTIFRVVLTAKSDGSNPEPCGEFQVIAYPKNLFSKGLPPPDSLPEIAIAGKFPGLRELLDQHKLRHRDVNLKTPDSLPPGSIVITETRPNTDINEFFADSKKLIFTSGTPTQLPWTLLSKNEALVVNAPPPADFRESPFAQRTLRTLLR